MHNNVTIIIALSFLNLHIFSTEEHFYDVYWTSKLLYHCLWIIYYTVPVVFMSVGVDLKALQVINFK